MENIESDDDDDGITTSDFNFIGFTFLNNFKPFPCSVKYSHHWKKRQALIDEIIAHDVEAGDEEFDDEYSDLHSSFVTKASELRELQERCGEWKKGRWSKQEYDILKTNLKSYMKEFNITDINILLDNADKNIEFYRKIACNIKRPLFVVYRKLLRFFTEENYVGIWTREMNDRLVELHALHGNDWNTIGQIMGIGWATCYDHFRTVNINKKYTEGPWSSEEVDKLCQVMVREHGIEDCQLPSNVTWEMISRAVVTRSAMQCRFKWVMLLSWKLKGGEEKWTTSDDLRLIECLNEDEELEDEEDIDWERLAAAWPSARSKYFLRQKWASLKRTVPFSSSKIFRECVLYLVRHRAPALRRQLDSMAD
ncbi:PREDICTED: cyclin-D-binding Myb-like transcription factor 1 isoform X1 [Amphimedon queenslandica]|uniref:Myb-like domain-containing protein n=1 Tax=Amphimedon queenslandica TaxID=400682 RepID=A0AAN0IUJ9_AMPQE|nr:PREDICTED: cyclin-D-binding Myb-like transcription factor 1 isoform X1 [Amphimedon queenslandica]|eukprot:XP_011409692.2 PREDICTED: cyclin-D-binding Myb-like transcription factor 1 isoform X1 [Amphimedon queenslandica]